MDIEELKRMKQEVDFYRSKINGITIKIEDMDPNFVYLMHTTTLNLEDTQDVYQNGLAYSGNEIWRTFSNLNQNFDSSRNIWKEKVELTSLEQVIVESCSLSFQCFLYKIPLIFFQPVDEEFYPIPIWYYDRTYQPKFNISSSGVPYHINEEKIKYFRIFPTLLLGHYDIRTNTFQKNPSYSYHISNPNGIYDRKQIISMSDISEYENFWRHNDYILNGEESPFEEKIMKIENNFHHQGNQPKSKC